jgi:hypothetical protein
MKEKTKKLELELRETQEKLRESSANEKRLERQKQMDEMTIAGITGIKNESTKEIIKLTQRLGTVKLDLLAERQLRRIHQTTLHELNPEDENYNPRTVQFDETVNGSSDLIALSSSPFVSGIFKESPPILDYSLNKQIVVPETKPYIIPSKIQKGSNKETSIKASRLTNFKNQRSLWIGKKPEGFQFLPPTTTSTTQPSTSSASMLSKNQKRAFGEGLFFTEPISAATANSSTAAAGSSFFNFSINSPTFPLVTSSSGLHSSNFATPLRNYREILETSPPQNGSGGPKISDR